MPSVTEPLNLSGPMQMNLGLYHKQLVVHAAGGVLLLSVITAISVIKPWGAVRAASGPAAVALDSPAVFEQRRLSSHGIKRLALILIVAVIVLFIVLHLAGGHFLHH